MRRSLDQHAVFDLHRSAAGGALQHRVHSRATTHFRTGVGGERGLQRYRAEQGGAVGVVVVLDHSAGTIVCYEAKSRQSCVSHSGDTMKGAYLTRSET